MAGGKKPRLRARKQKGLGYETYTGSLIEIEDEFDLPHEKRRGYAISELERLDLDESAIRDGVLYTGYLADTGPNCEGIMPLPSLDKWLNDRDRELQAEFKALKKRLREKWSAA